MVYKQLNTKDAVTKSLAHNSIRLPIYQNSLLLWNHSVLQFSEVWPHQV